ncbi:hypothetical protein ACF0H5_012104 [Mactra antiquata]
MYLYFVFILCVLIGNTFGTDVSDKLTWLEARNQCNLTTPQLMFGDARVTVNFTGFDVDADNKWIGYIKAYTSMEYFGCVLKSHIPENTPSFTTKGSPGLCISACRNVSFIGVYEHQCYCFTRNLTVNTMERFCNLHCPDHKEIVCGGEPGNGKEYLSLYRTIVTDEKYSLTEVCMWYDIINGFDWNGCTSSFRMVCENKGEVWISELIEKWLPWIRSTAQCFRNESRPVTYESVQSLSTNESQQLWTGVVRSEVIYEYNNDDDVFNENLFKQVGTKYGYLKRLQDRVYEVHFTTRETKNSLCWKDIRPMPLMESTTKADHPSSTVIRSRSIPKSTTSKTSDGMASFITTKTTPTTERNNNTKQSEQTADGNDGMRFGIIAGGSALAAVVLLSTTIVLICRRKRRLKKQKILERAMEMTKRSQSSKPTVVSPPPDSLDRAMERSQHIYTEIDLDSVPKNTKKKPAKRNSGASSGDVRRKSKPTDQKDPTYDTTKPRPRRQEGKTDNTYDKLELEKSSTYDHIKHNKTHNKHGKKKVKDAGNVYDTTTIPE